MFNENKITYFAQTDYRNQNEKFGIKQSDRTRHVYVIGKTGMGKSTLLSNMAVQDIQGDHGIAIIDPHGSLVEELLDYVPKERIDDVLYFAPFDLQYPISFNVMESVEPDKRHLVANGLMSAFKKIWVDAWSARMEYILNNVLLALLEYPDATLLGVNRMLADKTYRKYVVNNISDVSVKAFWQDEFAKYGDRYMQEAGASIQNKIGQFVSNPLVRNLIGQPRSSFDARRIMDDKKIMLINLSKGKVGEDNANLIGSMLITKIYLAAMSRADVSAQDMKRLPNFYFFVDEFQSFANESFADILSEARKYKLNLTIAHQYIEQMTEEVRAAVFGNVGTMISFRVGANDAEYLEKEFAPEFTAEDLVNLGFAQIYLKLMIDGIGSKPFSATTLPPISPQAQSYKDEIIARSREQFAHERSQVEEDVIAWHQSPSGRLDDPRAENNRAKNEGDKSSSSDDSKQGNSKDRSGGREGQNNQDKNNRRQRDKNSQKSAKGKSNNHNKKTQRSESREKRLQDAISLRQLQDKKKKVTQKQKEPSQNHLKDLRDALASVLKDAQKESGKEQEKENPKEEENNEKQQENKGQHTQSKNQKKEGKDEQTKSEKDDKGPDANQDSASKDKGNADARKSNQENDAPQKVKQEKEVPEDVLKKVLGL